MAPFPRVSLPPDRGGGLAEAVRERVEDDAAAAARLERLVAELLQLDTGGLLDDASFHPSRRAGLPSLEACAAEFRRLLSARVAAAWPKDKGAVQQASRLLDAGNALLLAFERSAGSEASTAPAEEDAFWQLPPERWLPLLRLQAARGPGPATLPEAAAPGLRKRARSSSGWREDADWQEPPRQKARGAGLLPGDVQRQLALLLERSVEPAAAADQLQAEADGDSDGSSATAALLQHALERLHAGVPQRAALLTLPLEFSAVCRRLRRGSLPALPDLAAAVAEACREAGVEAGAAEPGKRAALLAQADAAAAALDAALRGLAAALRRQGSARAAAEAAAEADAAAAEEQAPPPELPPSIQANREAYFQGQWRKAPYEPRPYQRLSGYHVEGADRALLLWKLASGKAARCSGEHCRTPGELGSFSLEQERFETRCACLAANCECSAACGCGGACLNGRIQARQPLRLGADVAERDTWGMDCYTRRNIQDAALESQAFGPYTRAAVPALQPGSGDAVSRGETLPPLPAAAEQGQSEAERRAAEWHESVLLPAITQQGSGAWDLRLALQALQTRDAGTPSAAAAAAVAARLDQVGENYFRVHPKGVGIVCCRPGGLPPLTFVEEYYGEVYAPWRWFEIQDALKRAAGEELPDFYNIQLERPRDDPAGYDCLFIDAARKGAFVSRMSHSCAPNCQAVVMSAGARLTIAVFTLRHIADGEELTFDYSSVTESEKEFRAAVCLCGTAACRASFLSFAGSKAFMQVLSSHHGMFARQALILRAGAEPLTQADTDRLEKFGLRESALGWGPGRGRVPSWLQKWVALVLAYVELERELLPAALRALPPPLAAWNETAAKAQARGVADNRLQNVVFTLDKVKLCLGKPGQPQGAPLLFLTDAEVLDFLWTGDKSVARRLLRSAAPSLSDAHTGRAVAEAAGVEELRAALAGAVGHPKLQALGEALLRPVASAEEARQALLAVSEQLRAWDREAKAPFSAAADLVFLYASTRHWFRAVRDYKSFISPPVRLSVGDLGGRAANGARKRPRAALHPEASGGPAAKQQRSASVGAVGSAEPDGTESAADTDADAEEVEQLLELPPENGSGPPSGGGLPRKGPGSRGGGRGGLCKKYGPLFLWGQLNGWYKQTVVDPTASLSAERRGTITLPDVECCFEPRFKYGAKEHGYLVEQIERRPEGTWRSSMGWSFKNESKVFGSPMFDAAWCRATGRADPMPAVLARLRGGGGR